MNNAYFLDTSALIKLYVQESGSDWVQKQLDNRFLFISRLACQEIQHTLKSAQKKESLKPIDAHKIIQSFRNHLKTHFYVVERNQELCSIEAELLSQYSLKMDHVIQLASALLIKPHLDKVGTRLIFVSADDLLLEIAKAENLETENPNHSSPQLKKISREREKLIKSREREIEKLVKYIIRGVPAKSVTTNLPLKLDRLPETLQAEGAIRLELVEGIPIFRASDRIRNRFENLLSKQKESILNSEEEKELDDYKELVDYLSLVNHTVRNLYLT